MSKQKNFLRLLAMCVTLVMLLACFLTLFVACGENDNGNDNTPDNGDAPVLGGVLEGFNAESLEKFTTIISEAFGYAATHYSNSFCTISFSPCREIFDEVDDADYDDDYDDGDYYHGVLGYASIEIDTPYSEDDIYIEFCLYDSIENANAAFEIANGNAIQNGDIVIISETEETLEETIDAMKNCTFPSTLLSEKEVAFIDEVVKTATSADSDYKILEIQMHIMNNYLDNRYGSITAAHTSLWMATPDSEWAEQYICVPQIVRESGHMQALEFINFENNRDEYTEDSYLKLENEVYYFYGVFVSEEE